MRKFSAHGIGKALSILMAVLVFSSFAAKSLHCFQHDNLISTVSTDGENVDTVSADCYLCDFSSASHPCFHAPDPLGGLSDDRVLFLR